MINCPNCTKPLPTVGFFCGICLTQVKCKVCETPLELDYAGCVNCGTAKEPRSNPAASNHANTFRLHETSTDRTIEATFSDAVGKDLAGILRDSYASKLANQTSTRQLLSGNNSADYSQTSQETETDAEIIDVQNNLNPKHTTVQQQANDYPTLLAVAMKNLPASEVEWIAIYSFYASGYGQNIFTRDNILEKYEEAKRFNKDTTKRDLNVYLRRAVAAEYINPLQDGYSLLEKGAEKAKEILARPSSSSPKKNKGRAKVEKNSTKEDALEQNNKTKKATKGNNSSAKRLSNLDLAPSGKKSLKDFYKEWDAKNNNENNLLFVYYLQEILKIEAISRNHIYTCYDDLELIIPENLTGSINNAVVRKGWIQTQNGFISLTTKGANHLKTWKNKTI